MIDRLPDWSRHKEVAAFALPMASLFAMLGASTNVQTASDQGLTGPQIFARAMATWRSQPQAAYVSYDVIARVTRKGRTREQREHVLFRSADRIAIIVTTTCRPAFGRPRFIPDVAFRLVPRVANTFDSTLEAKESLDAARPPVSTIGIVAITLHRYDVVSFHPATYDGQSVYHLKLVPLFSPAINSVREMWVDTRTFVTWGVTDESRFGIGPARGAFLLHAHYAPVHDEWFLRNVTTSGTLRFGFIAVGGDADVTFTNISTPLESPPAYCFDRAGFDAHEARCEEVLRSRA